MTKTKEILKFLQENSKTENDSYLDIKTHLIYKTDNFFKFLEMIEEVNFQAKIVKAPNPFLRFDIFWRGRQIKTYPSKYDESLQELI